MKLGDVLKKLRNDRKLQQSDIAKLLNVDRSTVGKWENNSSFPDPIKLDKLATYFGVTTDYLLGREELKDKEPVKELDLSEEKILTMAAHNEGHQGDLTKEEMDMVKKAIRIAIERNK